MPSTADLLKMIDTLKAQVEASAVNAVEPEDNEGFRIPALKAKRGPKKRTPEGDRELMLQVAELSLERFGSPVPPKEILYLLGEKVCSHCDTAKSIPLAFGFKKNVDGSIGPQGWCHECRKSSDSHPTRFGKAGRGRG